MAMMTFTLSITNELLTRLQLLLLVVMTAVMLKTSFSSHLPVISYLTYVVRFRTSSLQLPSTDSNIDLNISDGVAC